MLYTKIRIEDKYFPKRLYRVVAIKGNPKLSVLGAIIGQLFNASFEHYYLFRSNGKSYVANSWLHTEWSESNDKSMAKHYLDDLGENFEYEYDTGEGYEFKCKKYKKQIELDMKDLDEDEIPDVVLLEGKGAGIFENNHYMLDMYLDNELDPNFSEADENIDEHLFMPYNLDLEKVSDFDNELILEDYENFYENVEYISDHFDEDEYDEDFEDYDDIDDNAFDEELLLEEVAYDVFNSKIVNKVFRQLIRNMDINDAYELLCDTYRQLEKEDEENEYSSEEYGKIFEERINNLLKH